MSEISQPGSAAQSARDLWGRVARRVRVPFGFILAVVYVWLARPTWASLMAGLLLVIPGLALRGLASGHLQKDRKLTTSGPYAYTRNPLYLGSLMLAAGFAIAARSVWMVGGMLLMFGAIYLPVMAGEERYLRRTFPGYVDYARQVPRLLPRLTRYGNERGAYSGERYWKHREYQASLGCLAMLAVLVLKLVW